MEKRVSESRTEQVQILTQAELNGYGRLFGGRLMEWIDIVIKNLPANAEDMGVIPAPGRFTCPRAITTVTQAPQSPCSTTRETSAT